MNLFILSLIHKECAEMMMDKHISKMIIEAVQMLCTTKHLLDPEGVISEELDLYRMAHKNHPVTIWIRTSLANYMWTLDMVEAMHNEWKYRYGHPPEKMHSSYCVAELLSYCPPREDQFPEKGLTPFALAMPDKYKVKGDAVESYRQYYQCEDKQRFASWKKRDIPEWYIIRRESTSQIPISLYIQNPLQIFQKKV